MAEFTEINDEGPGLCRTHQWQVLAIARSGRRKIAITRKQPRETTSSGSLNHVLLDSGPTSRDVRCSSPTAWPRSWVGATLGKLVRDAAHDRVAFSPCVFNLQRCPRRKEGHGHFLRDCKTVMGTRCGVSRVGSPGPLGSLPLSPGLPAERGSRRKYHGAARARVREPQARRHVDRA